MKSTVLTLACVAALSLSVPALAQQKDHNDKATDKSAATHYYNGFLLSSKITGSHVKNHQNEDIGTIDNLVVNPETGRVRFAVLGVGGFLGIGRVSASEEKVLARIESAFHR